MLINIKKSHPLHSSPPSIDYHHLHLLHTQTLATCHHLLHLLQHPKLNHPNGSSRPAPSPAAEPTTITIAAAAEANPITAAAEPQTPSAADKLQSHEQISPDMELFYFKNFFNFFFGRNLSRSIQRFFFSNFVCQTFLNVVGVGL